MKLKKVVKKSSISFESYLIDENGKFQGEYICFDGEKISDSAFVKDGYYIGKYIRNGKYYYKSLIKKYKDSDNFLEMVEDYDSVDEPLKISETEYRKELAMARLGLIELPKELSFFLKDYEVDVWKEVK